MYRALIERLSTVVVGVGVIVIGHLLKIEALTYIGTGLAAMAVPHPATRLKPPV